MPKDVGSEPGQSYDSVGKVYLTCRLQHRLRRLRHDFGQEPADLVIGQFTVLYRDELTM